MRFNERRMRFNERRMRFNVGRVLVLNDPPCLNASMTATARASPPGCWMRPGSAATVRNTRLMGSNTRPMYSRHCADHQGQ